MTEAFHRLEALEHLATILLAGARLGARRARGDAEMQSAGASPFAVFDRMEIAELTTRSILDAGGIGRLRPMADEALQEICRVYGC